MKQFMQIDRGVTVNGKYYVVRVHEYPGGEWRAYDLNREFYVSAQDKEIAFELWKKKAEKNEG